MQIRRIFAVVALSLLACTPLSERDVPHDFECVPAGWSFYSSGSGHAYDLVLKQGAPAVPGIYRVESPRYSYLYIEAGADHRCPGSVVAPVARTPYGQK